MASPEEQQTPLEELGSRLRALRVQAGASGEAFARTLGWQQSKVSRIETGKQLPSPADIDAWGRAASAEPTEIVGLLQLQDGARVWRGTFRNRMSHGQEAVQKDYTDLAASSTLIRHFEMSFVPGPLQIPGYTKRVLTEMTTLHELEIDDVDAAVRERAQRTFMLYDPGKRWEFLLAEPVLHWLLPAPDVMREQLDRLQSVIGLERIRFGVVPMGAQLATTPQNTVELYYTAEGIIGVTETFIGETWHQGDEAEKYARALDLQWADAVEGDAARELILRAIRSLP